MNTLFSQPKVIYKIHFITNFKSIGLFEKFFPEDTPGISTYEIESTTIDAQDGDLWSFEVYLTEKPNFHQLQKELTTYANKHNILLASDITEEFIEDKDWVTEYQQQLKPIEIGRFIVTSTSQQEAHKSNKTPIFIEASRAFGTGDHATTSLCMQAMESLEEHKMMTIFDVGTGSGILSFAAEKIWPNVHILACDIEEVSVHIAKANLIVNNSRVFFYQNTDSDLNIPNDWEPKFDLIISNILAEPLIHMAKKFRSMSHSGTKIILSGFLDYQQNDVQDAYEAAGFIVEDILSRDRWIAMTLSVKSY